MTFDWQMLIGLALIVFSSIIALNGLNVLNIAPRGRRSAIHARAKGLRQIISGTINSDRIDAKTDEIVNGMGYSLDKETGDIIATPKGTFSYHALLNMIYK